jgi:DNA-binding beta-propeller fold protein YncE
MKKVAITTAAALGALAAGFTFGAWVYEGQWGRSGSGNGQFTQVFGVAVAANGNVYVADSGNYRIQYFTPTGSFLGKWGTRGRGDGQFDLPRGIAFGPQGYVYVADHGNHRVQYFTLSGSFIGKWGGFGGGPGLFVYPQGIGVAADGKVYVSEGALSEVDNTRIQYFTSTGSFLGRWGSRGSGNGRFRYPGDIFVARNGLVYVADCFNDRIQYFTTVFSTSPRAAFSAASGVRWVRVRGSLINLGP